MFKDDPPFSIWRGERGRERGGGGGGFATWRPPQTVNLRSDAGVEGAAFGDEKTRTRVLCHMRRRIHASYEEQDTCEKPETRVQEGRVGEDKKITGWAFGKERLPAMKNIFFPLPAKQIFLKSQ